MAFLSYGVDETAKSVLRLRYTIFVYDTVYNIHYIRIDL